MGNKSAKSKNSSAELSAKDIKILQASSKLTEPEIREWHKTFLTEYPSGNISRKEFAKLCQKFTGVDTKPVLANHMFAAFDTNHDGTISFNEFLMLVVFKTPGDIDSRLAYVFDLCDLSGDGKISIQEMAKYIHAALTLAGDTELDPIVAAAGAFTILGINKKKSLNKKQFIKGCKKDARLRQLFGGEE